MLRCTLLTRIKKNLMSCIEKGKISSNCLFSRHRTDLDIIGWQDIDIFKH